MGDGTFALCLTLLYQLYTMHGVSKEKTVSLVYSLMRTETKENYDEKFAALKKSNSMRDLQEENH